MKRPLYMDVADKITGYIKENKLQPGAKLPTYREFADIFGVSTRTVGNAIERLNYKRVVDIFPQSGIFVMNEAWEKLHPNEFNWNTYLSRSKDLPIKKLKRSAELRASPEHPKYMLSNISLSTEFGWHKLWTEASGKALDNLPREDIFAPADEIVKYKEALTEHMKSYGLDVPPENVVLAGDIHSSLRLIIQIFFRPGSVCYYVSPSVLDIYAQYCDMAGYVREPVPTDSEGIDIEYFARKIKKGRCSFMVVMPELSLSGITMSMRRRKELYQICSANYIPIIELDGFRDFRSESLPPIKALDKLGLVFYVNSFATTVNASKCGWIVAMPELVERLSLMFMSMWIGVDMFHHRTAYEMLVNGSYDRYIKDISKTLDQRKKIFHALLEKYLGDITTWDKKSNVFFWIKFRNGIDTLKITDSSERLTVIHSKQFAFAGINSLLVCILGMKQDEMETAVKQLSYLARKSIG